MGSGSETISSSRSLVFIMAGVAISFLLATLFSQYRATAIEDRVMDLIGNSLPSIIHLSNARAHLRDELDSLNRLRGLSGTDRSESETAILQDEQDVISSYKTYQGLPAFPGETKLSREIEQQIPAFSEAVHKLLQVSRGRVDRTRFLARLQAAQHQGLILDKALTQSISFDAANGQRIGHEISEIRVQSMSLAVFLDLLSVGLAAFATFMAVRMKNASVRGISERAEELETFAARVAHDLKNPLNSILIGSALMEDCESEAERMEINSKILNTARRMDQIIDGLLDFARAGAHPTPGGSAELGATVDGVLSSMNANHAGVLIDVASFRRPLILRCSQGVLASILSNLVRNACKYVVQGSAPRPEVKVRVFDKTKTVHIEVEDNGPGIPPEKQTLIFKAYFRGDQFGAGLGLGLATVQKLVEAHGGRVGVKSTPGQGSLFWVELPKA